jgi:hypothetical protein
MARLHERLPYDVLHFLLDLAISVAMFGTAAALLSLDHAAWRESGSWLLMTTVYCLLVLRFWITSPRPSGAGQATTQEAWLRTMGGWYSTLGALLCIAVFFFEKPKFDAHLALVGVVGLAAAFMMLGAVARLIHGHIERVLFATWLWAGFLLGVSVAIWRWIAPQHMTLAIVSLRHRLPLSILALVNAGVMLVTTVFWKLEPGGVRMMKAGITQFFRGIKGSIASQFAKKEARSDART